MSKSCWPSSNSQEDKERVHSLTPCWSLQRYLRVAVSHLSSRTVLLIIFIKGKKVMLFQHTVSGVHCHAVELYHCDMVWVLCTEFSFRLLRMSPCSTQHEQSDHGGRIHRPKASSMFLKTVGSSTVKTLWVVTIYSNVVGCRNEHMLLPYSPCHLDDPQHEVLVIQEPFTGDLCRIWHAVALLWSQEIKNAHVPVVLELFERTWNV